MWIPAEDAPGSRLAGLPCRHSNSSTLISSLITRVPLCHFIQGRLRQPLLPQQINALPLEAHRLVQELLVKFIVFLCRAMWLNAMDLPQVHRGIDTSVPALLLSLQLRVIREKHVARLQDWTLLLSTLKTHWWPGLVEIQVPLLVSFVQKAFNKDVLFLDAEACFAHFYLVGLQIIHVTRFLLAIFWSILDNRLGKCVNWVLGQTWPCEQVRRVEVYCVINLTTVGHRLHIICDTLKTVGLQLLDPLSLLTIRIPLVGKDRAHHVSPRSIPRLLTSSRHPYFTWLLSIKYTWFRSCSNRASHEELTLRDHFFLVNYYAAVILIYEVIYCLHFFL